VCVKSRLSFSGGFYFFINKFGNVEKNTYLCIVVKGEVVMKLNENKFG